MHKLFSRLLPLEYVMALALGGAALFILLFNLRIYLPDSGSSSFAINHYVTGAALAIAIGLAAPFLSGGSRNLAQDTLRGLRNLLAFVVIVFLHFNFKLWAQLANPSLYDATYQAIDNSLTPLIEWIYFINSAFSTFKEHVPHAYHDVFVYMFFATYIVFALGKTSRKHSEELTVCLALILVLGGISYSFAPAWGPFVYAIGSSDVGTEIQRNMAAFQEALRQSGGAAYSGGQFVAALGAMPSLHSAHALALWGYSRRHTPWLSYIQLPCLIFIFTEAIAAKWHYLIDLIFGAAITLICMLIAKWLCKALPPSADPSPLNHPIDPQ